MADIAPELYGEIKRIFDEKFAQAQLLGNSLGDVMARINSGDATFQDADMFAVEVGSMMADAMKQVLVLEDLPGGKLYRNIAQKTIGEGLKDTYGIVSNAAAIIQEEINGRANIGLKAVKPKLETDRVDKIVNRASNAKTQAALENNLTDTVPTFARQVVDDTQKANARLHNKAGLEVKVEREYDGVGLHDGEDVCEFCLERAGTWTYEKALDNGVFQRHEGCGCIITYTSAKGEVTKGTGSYLGGDRSKNNGRTTTGWKWETQEEYEKRIGKEREDRNEYSAAAGTLPDKMKKYIPSLEDRKRIIEQGIHEERAIFVEKSDPLYNLAKGLPEEEGFYTVTLHGHPYCVEFKGEKIDADTLCAIIAQRDDYKKGTDIRLISCYTGSEDDGVARYIAEKLKVNVIAPDKLGIINQNVFGRYSVYSGSEIGVHDGNMRFFEYKRDKR